MNDVTKDLLVRLRVLLSLHDARVDTADAWNLSMEEARSTIARAEAALAEPQPDVGGWIPWAGGACPVASDAVVDGLVSDGNRTLQMSCKYAYTLRWSYFPKAGDILAYRIVRK